MIGPGKYDDACTVAREAIGPQCLLCAVIAIDPIKGAGFALQCADAELVRQLPDMLDQLAAELRRDIKVMQ